MKHIRLKKKYSVKIPKGTNLLYCDKKNQITFIGYLKTKSLTTKVKLLFIENLNILVISNLPLFKTSNVGRKKAKSMQGTTLAKLKHIIIETNYTLYQKLNFVGVGYRVFQSETIINQIYFKLGYSHLIFFKIPEQLKTFSVKYTKLFLFGNISYDNLTQTSASIRDCKKPEPYKGKGILYHREKINLKKGKKI